MTPWWLGAAAWQACIPCAQGAQGGSALLFALTSAECLMQTAARIRPCDHTGRCLRYCAGEQLAISSHGCAVHFVSGLLEALAGGGAAQVQPQQQLLRLEQLPLRCVQHLSETKLVGAGFDGEVCPGVIPISLARMAHDGSVWGSLLLRVPCHRRRCAKQMVSPNFISRA